MKLEFHQPISWESTSGQSSCEQQKLKEQYEKASTSTTLHGTKQLFVLSSSSHPKEPKYHSMAIKPCLKQWYTSYVLVQSIDTC
jgi:hypothetical protein